MVGSRLDEEDLDWEIVSPEDGLPARTQTPYRKLIDLELATRLGTLSIKLGSSDASQSDVSASSETVKQSKDRLTQEQSPLFKLPAEVRLQVYEHLLRVETGSFYVKIIHLPDQTRPTVLSVLGTCHRIRAEAEHIFYATNRLYIRPGPFLSSLSPRRFEAISRVTVPAHSPAGLLTELEKLKTLPKLRSLVIARIMSIRFTDVPAWTLMQNQLSMVLTEFSMLGDLEITTPTTTSPNLFEQEQAVKLALIDTRLKQCRRLPTVMH